ncbi:MAG: acetyl-CoA carboxylase biotin carboxyl carrier protein [Clostridiales bacterium]|nr:acetyl-CoA carboxylase biotin carboxyl carrier protein [Clostridiales bacterium]
MEFEQILELIDRVSKSGLTAFSYEADGVKLSMEQSEKTVVVQPMTVVQSAPQIAEPAKAYAEAVPEEEPLKEGNYIKAPLVGTFYAAPAQDAEPFVSVGDRVKKGQIVAIVEAMKLMNEIESDFDGEIAEICVENGEAVEYGQPLFRVK